MQRFKFDEKHTKLLREVISAFEHLSGVLQRHQCGDHCSSLLVLMSLSAGAPSSGTSLSPPISSDQCDDDDNTASAGRVVVAVIENRAMEVRVCMQLVHYVLQHPW